MQTQEGQNRYQYLKGAAAKGSAAGQEAKPLTLQEVFHVDEGPVTLSAPAMLSPESYQDVADRLAIFLRGLKRRSEVRQMMIEDAGKGLDPEE